MNTHRTLGNTLGARGGGGGGGGGRGARSMVSVAPSSLVSYSEGPTKKGTLRSMTLEIPNLSPPDAVRSAQRSRGGWRGGAVPPWLDCDVDEDGELVCPDHFEFGALSGRTYRDWTFPEPTGGRYVYRQFETGDVFILETPAKGKLAEPLLVPRKSKAWTAISSAIYARKAGKRQAALNAFVQLANATATVISAGSKPRRGASKAPTPAESTELVEMETAPATGGGVSWIPIAVAGAVVVGVLAIFGGGKS